MRSVIEKNAWRLPWSGKHVPHALLDITRRCNITCRSCYNLEQKTDKTLAEIKAEIDELMSLRRLNALAIVGGEPTLHPSLVKIIAAIHERGLHVELFTNGLLLDDNMVRQLREAGLDMAFLHIQRDQQRSDLPDALLASQEKLLDEKIHLLSRHGIDAGLTMTAYDDRSDELQWAIDYLLRTPSLSYLLVTLERDVVGMSEVKGSIAGDMHHIPGGGTVPQNRTAMDLQMTVEGMHSRRAMPPFCFIGSNVDANDPRWVSFMSVCAYDRGVLVEHLPLRISLIEKLYIHLERMLNGRYPFYSRLQESKLKFHVVLNSLVSGRFSNLTFVRKTLGRGYRWSAKRILFQSLAYVDGSGRVVHCAHCPDAVLKEGKLVPVCIGDKVRVGQ